MTLDSLMKQAERDLAINQAELGSESTRTPLLYNKYLTKFIQERLRYKKYEADVQKLIRTKYHHYRNNFNVLLKPNEVAIYMDGDEEIIEMRLRLELCKQTMEFLEKVLKEISTRSFHIKNAIEFAKFQNGGY